MFLVRHRASERKRYELMAVRASDTKAVVVTVAVTEEEVQMEMKTVDDEQELRWLQQQQRRCTCRRLRYDCRCW